MARAKNNELRQKILVTAFRMIYENSVDEVLVKDIAASTGISVSLLHHYYDRKEDILVHIFYDMIYKVQLFVQEKVAPVLMERPVTDVVYIHYFYLLFYDILQRNNDKLLKIYSKVLFDAELLQNATDHAFSAMRDFPTLNLTNEERLSIYTLNGGMAQIVSLYLSKHNVLEFDIKEQLERQMQLVYFSAGLSKEEREATSSVVQSTLTQDLRNECYRYYMDNVNSFHSFDW